MTRSYQDTAWWRDDISQAQRVALRALREEVGGRACAGVDLPGVRLTTLRALHRLGLVKTDNSADVIQRGTMVTITQHGRDSIAEATS